MSKKLISFLATISFLLAVLAACGGNQNGGEHGAAKRDQPNQENENIPLGEKEITLLGDNYVSLTASTYVVKEILEKAGYTVNVKQVGVGTMFAGIAKGSADASLGAWLPHTHASYWEEYQDEIEKIGIVMEHVPLGLTVPSYMKEITSITDLANNTNHVGEKVNWTITGISPGAGEMIVTQEKVMPAYGMTDRWKLRASSGPAMTAALSKAIANHEPIVVTLWYPHWAFVKWDLRLLEDPKNMYGDPDDVYAIARQGFKEDSPLAYKILSQFQWTKEQNGKVMLKMENGMSPEEAAEEFIQNHPELVEKWTEGIEALQ